MPEPIWHSVTDLVSYAAMLCGALVASGLVRWKAIGPERKRKRA